MSTSRTSTGWAFGFAAFAGAIMLLVGVFHAFAGLAAILDDQFFVTAANYTYEVDVTGWGWIHLIFGVIVALAGIGIYSGAGWARSVGLLLALLSAIANFFFIPYYPIWAVLMIALDIVIIWALVVYSGDEPAPMR